MANPPMTIRNLTSSTIQLSRYEIHDRLHRIDHGLFANIKKNVAAVLGHGHVKNQPLQQSTMESISHELAPFKTSKANVKAADLPHQILSIIFEIEGEPYQTNIIHSTCHSQYLMAIPPPNAPDSEHEPRFHHIAVYLPQYHHLTIAYRNHYATWMQNLQEGTPLSALSIPGTHNSPTYHHAFPSVRCQVVPVREQLLRGVRFLDIRVQPDHPDDPSKDSLTLVHGVFPISLTGPRHFKPIVQEVLSFLDRNHSETVIMCVKREGTGHSTDAQLSRILHDHYVKDTNRWFTAPRIPTLGEARGKIVLIRRFTLDESLKREWDGAGWGINADTWADNSPHSMCPSGDVCIQDFYEVLETATIGMKIQYSIDHLKRAAERVCAYNSGAGVLEPKQPFLINFLTASNFWRVGCWPDRIAQRLNPAIVEYLCTKHNEPEDGYSDLMERRGGGALGDGSTGIVVCDWVGHGGDWDIVRCIVGFNARYENIGSIISK